MRTHRPFEALEGVTLTAIERVPATDTFSGNEALIFRAADGRAFCLTHIQDCCENVRIEDITGDLADLIGAPISSAKLETNQEDTDYGTQTWSVYHRRTPKGDVTLRWLGDSNGYYGEEVDFFEFKEASDGDTD